MPTSKLPTIKGLTRKVPPKPHSPPAAPDSMVSFKSSQAKIGTARHYHRSYALEGLSPPSSSNQASAAASTLLSLVTVPTSVAAAASTILYRQLYSAEDNDHKEEQLYSDDDEDKDDDGDEEGYVGIHKQPIDEDYDNILDMDIDSEEEFRSSFPKNQNSSKLRVKGGGPEA
jgi:hypothetical protein